MRLGGPWVTKNSRMQLSLHWRRSATAHFRRGQMCRGSSRGCGVRVVWCVACPASPRPAVGVREQASKQTGKEPLPQCGSSGLPRDMGPRSVFFFLGSRSFAHPCRKDHKCSIRIGNSYTDGNAVRFEQLLLCCCSQASGHMLVSLVILKCTFDVCSLRSMWLRHNHVHDHKSPSQHRQLGLSSKLRLGQRPEKMQGASRVTPFVLKKDTLSSTRSINSQQHWRNSTKF